MSRISIINNIPSPYMVDLYYYLQTHWQDDTVSIIYTSHNEDNRLWTVPRERILNSEFLPSRVLKIPQKTDTKYLHLPKNMGRVLAAQAPDVVVAWEYNLAALQSLLWCRHHGVPFVHGTDGTLYSERNIILPQKLLRKYICSAADACIASSTRSAEKLMAWGVPEEKIFISLLTKDLSGYRNLKRMPVPGRLLYVGSMIERKGLDLLMEALGRVSADFRLHIVGNGSQEQISELKRRAELAGIGERIVFRGFLEGEALLEEYRQAQVFVLPTREDCYGLVLLEAMCAGVPVVSSKYADGAYDILTEGENGLIADPYCPEEFGGAIEKALREFDSRKGPDEASVNRFSFETTVQGYRDAIGCALRSKQEDMPK